MAVVFKIDGKSLRCEGEIIAIGRSPSNQVSLPNDSRLAPVQAVLRLVAGRWIIEARDGGPIRVGTGRPTQFAWLNPDDVIHLTENGPEVIFTPEFHGATAPPVATSTPPSIIPIPAAPQPPPQSVTPQTIVANSVAKPTAPLPPAVHSPPATDANRSDRPTSAAVPQWIVFLGLGGLAAAIFIGVGVYLGDRGRPSSAPSTTSIGPTEKPADPVVVPPGTTNPAPEIPASDPRRALYRLELRTADRSKTVQLGTAWAVGPRRLVTTGDAARGIPLNQEFYPVALVKHSVTGEEYEVGGMTLHPAYATATGKVDQMALDIKRLLPELERTTEPDDQKKIEDELHKLDADAITALEETINVNVATLDVAKDLPSSLSIDPVAPLKIGQQLTLMGHPIPRNRALVDPDHPTPVQQLIGRLQHTDPVTNPAVPLRCLMTFDAPQKDQNWSGSPVLNAQGTVIGLYSNPTHPPPGVASIPIETHDITVIDGVRDWLPKTPTTHADKAN